MARKIVLCLALGLLLTGALVVGACGGGDDQQDASTVSSQAADETTTTNPQTDTTVEPSETSDADVLGDEVDELLQELEDANAEADDLGDVTELD